MHAQPLVKEDRVEKASSMSTPRMYESAENIGKGEAMVEGGAPLARKIPARIPRDPKEVEASLSMRRSPCVALVGGG